MGKEERFQQLIKTIEEGKYVPEFFLPRPRTPRESVPGLTITYQLRYRHDPKTIASDYWLEQSHVNKK